ncbi:MAG: serine hydrolase [Bacteroidia bacterium]|nr:serine hydrolase [Bacteroidia bacterium]
MVKNCLAFFLVLCNFFFNAQTNSRLLDSVIGAHPALKQIFIQKAKYRPQIIYTQINRDKNNKPSFKDFTYQLDSTNYFYCASLVKLPCSVFALEKINALKLPGLNRATTMLTDSVAFCQKKTWDDTSAQNGKQSIEHHIKKMLLVSDNNSYSRVFEFLNPKYISNRLTQLGHPTARIIHRFDVPCIGKGNHYFNPVRFVDETGRLVYNQPADSLTEEFKPPFGKVFLGKNVYNKRKRLIAEGKDFTKSNYLSLQMIHNFLRDLIFNAYKPNDKQFNITQNDWEFLVKHLGMYPRESEWPRYPTKTYYDSFKKYFIYGSAVPTIGSDTLRIFNIVGRAYGFQIDCAYIVDFRTNTEFMLSAVIYTNKRNSFGTGTYEYDAIGLPFLKELSLALYTLETGRKRKQEPDLSSFKFYQKQ